MNTTYKFQKLVNPLFTGLFILLMGCFSACETEDEGLTELNLPAPTNIDATFIISNDNTGTLTVAPSGSAVTRFEVYFGDVQDEEASVALPGERLTHVYAEGDYIMTIIGVGPGGQTAETTKDVVIRFDPPANLEVDLAISNRSLTVTPTADGATLFDVFFGDVADEEATQVLPGENTTHIYDDTGDYIVKVIARGAGAATAEFTDTITISESIVLPVNFEANDVSYNFVDFGGAVTTVVDNPDMTGNTSMKVAQTLKTDGSEVWAGSFIEISEPLNFSAFKKVRLNVWSPKAGITVKLKVENAADGNIAAEVDMVTTTSNAWEEILFDFSGIDVSQSYSKVVVFFDFGNNGDGSVYYFDGIELTNDGTPALDLPIDFESSVVPYSYTDFGGATTSVVDNPDPSGINSSSKVAYLFKSNGSEVWAGSFLQLDAPIDFSAGKIFTLKSWSPKAGAVIKLKIENSADGSIAFEADANTTVTNAWEELTYDFSGVDDTQDYDRVVVFFDFGNNGDGSNYYYDDIRLSDGSEVLELPLTFESASLAYSFIDFGNAASAVIDNPDASGINASNKVAQFTKPAGAEVWAGTFLEMAQPIDFSTKKTFKVKVWSPKAGAVVKLKVENATDGSIGFEIDQTTTTTNAWEELTYDFSAIDTSQEYSKVVIFFDFGVGGDDSVYYWDDVTLTN